MAALYITAVTKQLLEPDVTACSYSATDNQALLREVLGWVASQGQAESPFSRHTLYSSGAFLVPITGQYNRRGSLRSDSLQWPTSGGT